MEGSGFTSNMIISHVNFSCYNLTHLAAESASDMELPPTLWSLKWTRWLAVRHPQHDMGGPQHRQMLCRHTAERYRTAAPLGTGRA